MSSRIYKRENIYYIDCRINGKRIRKSAGPSRADAEALIEKLTGVPHTETLPLPFRVPIQEPELPPIPVKDLIQRYLDRQQIHAKTSSFQSAESCCRRLKAHFGKMDALKLKPRDLEAFIADRLKKVSREGANRDLRYLKALLRQAVDEQTIPTLPFKIKLLKTTRKLPTILSTEELRHLLEKAGPDIRPILLTAAMTGLRNSELRSIWWEDIDFQNHTLAVRAKPELDFSPKSHAEREIPLNALVMETLQQQRSVLAHTGPQNLVFPRDHETGSRWDDSGLCKAVKAVFKDAGLADTKRRPGLHLLRRTFASHALANGTDIETVRELGGWASLEVVQRYVRSSDGLKRAAVERLTKLAS